MVANPVMVRDFQPHDHGCTETDKSEKRDSKSKTQSCSGPPNGRQITSNSSEAIRDSLRRRGFSREVSNTMLNARKEGTRVQYQVYLKAWYEHCGARGISPTRASVPECLDFLEITRKERNLSYSSVNVMRCALSAVVAPFKGVTFGDHPDTVLYMRGVFNELPKVPKYQEIWDVNIVLQYLKKISPAEKLPLKSLTLKTATLLMIVTGQRVQTLSLLSLEKCKISSNKILFVVTENVKTSKPGTSAVQVQVEKYVPDQRLCIVRYLKEYIKRTQAIRASSQLFISHRRPYTAVKKGTIAHWVKAILRLSGINTELFSGHSVRSATCSKAARVGVPLNTIMKQGGWRQESTFQKYYNKPLVGSRKNFAKSVLS